MYLHTFCCFDFCFTSSSVFCLLCIEFCLQKGFFPLLSFAFYLLAFYFCLLCLNFCIWYFGFGFLHAIFMIKRHFSTPSNFGSKQTYRQTIDSVSDIGRRWK